MRFPFFKRKSKDQLFTIAFYNLENLFDAENSKHTLDDDFTPTGFKQWTEKRYKSKCKKLARTILDIGKKENKYPPVLVGVSEVENQTVIKDLIGTTPLESLKYNFVHYESPDERGIDTALLYNPKYFRMISSEALPLIVDNLNGDRDTTRDILYVKGTLNNEPVHVFVNHWPSRRDGGDVTEYKRLIAAKVIKEKMKKIEITEISPNYMVMGDFNDDPTSKSIQSLLEGTTLYNPMEKLHFPKQRGSANYKNTWSLFDQILISHNFLNYEKGTHSFSKADIFDASFLKEKIGKYKGNPHRTYAGSKYLGGYSDHFPVYIVMKFNPK
ncbi:endonuclease [Maribacter chungangensis]|uniref:Endonuclease n=1 Tax=Maribacter chungangensis TaxID=1069117 RepID=A0ABW3AY51_9FLAO